MAFTALYGYYDLCGAYRFTHTGEFNQIQIQNISFQVLLFLQQCHFA